MPSSRPTASSEPSSQLTAGSSSTTWGPRLALAGPIRLSTALPSERRAAAIARGAGAQVAFGVCVASRGVALGCRFRCGQHGQAWRGGSCPCGSGSGGQGSKLDQMLVGALFALFGTARQGRVARARGK
eukprot:3180244-Prymnesium_polylepis.1